MSTQSALRAADFTQSIGVNVHMEYTDGGYAKVNNVIADLKYLGVTQVRDQTLNPHNQGQSAYGAVAASGVQFDMIINGVSGSASLASQLALLDTLVKQHPGAISAIEGTNEVNNDPVSFNGTGGNAGAVALTNALVSAVGADPTLASVSLYNLTSWPDLASNAPIANYHSYPKLGAQPYGTLASNYSAQAATMAGKPMVLTEAGYFTLVNKGGVDLSTQGKLTLNLLMDATKLGVKQIYLYQLLDAYADPTNSNPEKHYGLFDINNTPKPVAVDIHNLTTILSDSASNGHSFAATGINYSVTGLPSTGSSFQLEKSSGAHDIVVWNEPAIWNSKTATPIPVSGATVTVNLGATYQTVSVFDPLQGTTAISTAHNVSSIQLSLTDHPLIVEVSSATGPTTPLPTPVVSLPVVTAGRPSTSSASTAAHSDTPAIFLQPLGVAHHHSDVMHG
jgi:hypothetical protein